MTITEKITNCVARHLLHTNSELVAKNIHYIKGSDGGSLEADVLRITKSGYIQEYEVKVSRKDFFKDKEKKIMFHPKTYTKHEALVSNLLPINQFYFVMTRELAEELKNDIPPFAGVVNMIKDLDKYHYYFNIFKKAPKLGRPKADLQFKYDIAKKFYYKYWG